MFYILFGSNKSMLEKIALLKKLFKSGGEPVDPASDLVNYGRVDYMTLTE